MPQQFVIDTSPLMAQAESAYVQRQFALAQTYCLQVVGLQPAHFDATHLLGVVAVGQGDYPRAEFWLRKALGLKPDNLQVLNSLGLILRRMGRTSDAIEIFRRAIAVHPEYAEAYLNLGNLSRDRNAIDEALQYFQRAIRSRPDYAEAHLNKGVALMDTHRLNEAIHCFDEAIRCRPDFSEAHLNNGFSKLMLGDYEQGWQDFEHRWGDPQMATSKRDFAQPQWRGEDIAGKTILIYGEQGLGDCIQLCRYVPLVAAKGARVLLDVPQELAPLCGALPGVDRVLITHAVGQTVPAFDYQCPMFSLPAAFNTTLATIPSGANYLHVSEEIEAEWAKRLGPRRQPRVGIAWSGRPEHRFDHHRSMPLATMLKALPDGIDIVSVQNSIRDADQVSAAQRPDIQHFGHILPDFAATAGLIAQLDLVISVDTAVAHLAAALGKPTWVLLSYQPEWRWMLDREDSPWYPSVRLFRQITIDDWAPVVQEVHRSLVNRFKFS